MVEDQGSLENDKLAMTHPNWKRKIINDTQRIFIFDLWGWMILTTYQKCVYIDNFKSMI